MASPACSCRTSKVSVIVSLSAKHMLLLFVPLSMGVTGGDDVQNLILAELLCRLPGQAQQDEDK